MSGNEIDERFEEALLPLFGVSALSNLVLNQRIGFLFCFVLFYFILFLFYFLLLFIYSYLFIFQTLTLLLHFIKKLMDKFDFFFFVLFLIVFLFLFLLSFSSLFISELCLGSLVLGPLNQWLIGENLLRFFSLFSFLFSCFFFLLQFIFK